MGFFCSILIGTICLFTPLGNTDIHVQNFGMGGVVEIRGKGWRASSDHSDVRLELVKDELPRHCQGNLCVFYRRHCGRIECTYLYGVAAGKNPAWQKNITIKAVDGPSLNEALSHIGIALSPDHVLALTELSAAKR